MVKRKRAYVPKVKGCYECSQRRVNCDRGQPSCAKCLDKGLQCSGLGIRYRFSHEGGWRGRNLRVCEETGSRHNATPRVTTNISGILRKPEPFSAEETLQIIDEDENALDFDYEGLFELGTASVLATDTDDILATNFSDLDKFLELGAPEEQQVSEPASHSPLNIVPNHALSAWKRHFFLHFSERVASELVVIDDHRNGWRNLVLPIANEDELVMDTVLSASAFHFASNLNSQLYEPSAIYANAIRKLRERQNLDTQDLISKQSVLLALLVLLATVMVNGGTDFPTVFNLLESAVGAAGGEDALMKGELGIFVVRQIRKYRGYAAPFLSKVKGTARLRLTSESLFGQEGSDGWECFRSYYQSSPAFSENLSLLYELNRQACNIYVARAVAGSDGVPLDGMVQSFRETLDKVPAGSVGEHVLVWSIFMAAAEARDPEQRQHFNDVLVRHQNRNGFSNIGQALDYLRTIWSNSQMTDWTELLPEMYVFVV